MSGFTIYISKFFGLEIKFTRCDRVCDNVKFLWTQVMGSCFSDFHCDIDPRGEVFFDVVSDVPCEWTFRSQKQIPLKNFM